MFTNSHNVIIQGGTYTQIQGDNSGREFDLLRQATSTNALHDSGHDEDPPKCLPNTREAIQKRIMTWLEKDFQAPDGRLKFMMWIKGSAGVGKTAIARTIAERCAEQGTLLASFFFSRSRNDVENFVATVVYQITQKIPESLEIVAAAIKKNPLIFRLVLTTQFRSLIVEPLQKLVQSGCVKYSAPGVHHVIMLDGLDECQTAKSQINVLKMLANLIPLCPIPIHLFVASRPEQHIVSFFQSTPFSDMTIELDVNKEFSSYDDIQTFLDTQFDEIKATHQIKKHIPPGWPSSSNMKTLLDKASGQFIHAATVIKYVTSPYYNPVDRLDEILSMGSSSAVGIATSPLSEVDALYHGIISRIHYPWEEVRKIVTPILFYPGISVDDLEKFLHYKPGDIRLRLTDLSSVISVVEDGSTTAKPFHASFQDFLVDPSRSNDFCITGPRDHTAIVRRSFEILRDRDRILFRLAMHLLNSHIKYAELNPEVRQDILNFSFPGFRFLHDTKALDEYFSYFTTITREDGRLAGLDADIALNRQQNFRQELTIQLHDYYRDPRLTLLLVVALHHQRLHSFSGGGFRHNTSNVAELDMSKKMLDQRSLMLCETLQSLTNPFDKHAKQYLDILQQCFHPVQGGSSFSTRYYFDRSFLKEWLTGTHYASATIVACKYVNSHVKSFCAQTQLGPVATSSVSPSERENFSQALDIIALALPLSARVPELMKEVGEARESLAVGGLDKLFSQYFQRAKEQIWR